MGEPLGTEPRIIDEYQPFSDISDTLRGVFGEPSTVCGSPPGILENPVVKPIVPVATARTVPLEEPTILEMLAQSILN